VSKTTEPTNHNAPRSCRLTHYADEEVPQLLQRRSAHGDYPSLAAEWYVDVDARRLEQFATRVRAGRKEPALIRAQAVRAEQDAGAIHRIQQRRTDAPRRRQHKWGAIRHRAATAVPAAVCPHLLRRRCRTETGQRPTRQRQRQRTTTARVDGKTQVLEELRPAAEWNEISDRLLRHNL